MAEKPEKRENIFLQTCQTHSTYNCEYFCMDCNTFICENCANDVHMNHRFLLQKAIIENVKIWRKKSLLEQFKETLKSVQAKYDQVVQEELQKIGLIINEIEGRKEDELPQLEDNVHSAIIHSIFP